MAWDRQKNGRAYYSQSRRHNGKIVRIYVGTGPAAEAIAQADAQRRAAHLHQRDQERIDRTEWANAEAVTIAAADLVARLAKATLLDAGYHQHARSSWRKRKHVQPNLN